MEKLKNVLREYGLELTHNLAHKGQLENSLRIIAKKERDSIKLLASLRVTAFKIEVKDYQVLKEKMNLGDRYDVLKHLIQTEMKIDLFGYEHKSNRESTVARLRLDNIWEFYDKGLRKRLEKEPEKYGLSSKEFRLETMFNPEAYQPHHNRLMRLVNELIDAELCSEQMDLLGTKIVEAVEGLTIETVYKEFDMPQK